MNESDFEAIIAKTLTDLGWKQDYHVPFHHNHLVGERLHEFIEASKSGDAVLKYIPNTTEEVVVLLEQAWRDNIPTNKILKNGLRLNKRSYQIRLLDADHRKNIFSFTQQYSHD